MDIAPALRIELPYESNFASCGFALLSYVKMEIKGRLAMEIILKIFNK